MRSYHATSGGGLASLAAKEHPVPRPGPREVLIRVRANSLNARELSGAGRHIPLPVKPDVIRVDDDLPGAIPYEGKPPLRCGP
jgi:NADPH:quinone reductase-like Zn-dependent oxidoreductase